MLVVVLITCPCLIECVVLAVSTDPPGRPLARMPLVDVHADLAGGEVIVRDRELVRRRVCLFGRCAITGDGDFRVQARDEEQQQNSAAWSNVHFSRGTLSSGGGCGTAERKA